MDRVNFRGRSGRLVSFRCVAQDGDWAGTPGVALFAAPDTYGWRIIRMVEMTGRTHDVQPFWAQLDAARYGARAIFIHDETDFEVRRALIADLEAGLSPVFPAFTGAQPESLRLAA